MTRFYSENDDQNINFCPYFRRMNSLEIVKLIKQRDEKGLSYLYDNYSGSLNGIILRILNSEKLAEEVLQQTFLKIWDKIAQYDESKATLFTWMSRIARNSAIDIKRLKRTENLAHTDSLDLSIHNSRKEEINLAKIDADNLISKLDPKFEAVVSSIYLKGFTHKETAEALGIPIGTVKTRLRNGLLELRKQLKKETPLFLSITLLITLLICFV